LKPLIAPIPAGDLLARVQRLHPRHDHDLPGIQPAGDDNPGGIEPQHVDVAKGHRAGRRIHDPDGGLLIGLRQRARGYFDDRAGLDLHPPVDGRAEPHCRRRIGQADLDLEGPGHGICLWRHLAHAPPRRHCRIVRQAHGDLRIARCRADQLGRHVKDRVAPVLARDPNDHLSGLDHLTGARADSRQHTGCIRLELGEAHQIVCGLELRFGGVDLRLGGLKCLLRLIMIGPRGPALFEQRVLALEVIARLGQLPLGGRETGLRGPQGVALVLRLETSHQLPGLDPIAAPKVVFKDAAGDAESERHLVLRLDAAGQRDGYAGLSFLHRDGANRSRLGRGRLDLSAA
jgi:hypothetical protein